MNGGMALPKLRCEGIFGFISMTGKEETRSIS